MPLATRMREAAALVAALVTDTFTRADSTTTLGAAETGQAWSALVGTWGIQSNQARCVSGGNGDLASVAVGVTDMTVSAVIAVTGAFAGVTARQTDAFNFYLADAGRLFKDVGGSFTQLGTFTTYGTGDTLSLAVTGTAIVAKVNGAGGASATDSALTTGTQAGLRTGTGTTPRWDNFQVTSP